MSVSVCVLDSNDAYIRMNAACMSLIVRSLDASYYSASSTASANLVFTTNAGTKKLYECSNQGVCDYST